MNSLQIAGALIRTKLPDKFNQELLPLAAKCIQELHDENKGLKDHNEELQEERDELARLLVKAKQE